MAFSGGFYNQQSLLAQQSSIGQLGGLAAGTYGMAAASMSAELALRGCLEAGPTSAKRDIKFDTVRQELQHEIDDWLREE